jgi:hypothetical protein
MLLHGIINGYCLDMVQIDLRFNIVFKLGYSKPTKVTFSFQGFGFGMIWGDRAH